MNPESRLSWTGWLRDPGGDWRRAVVAPSWSLCWDALLARLAESRSREAPVACQQSVEALVNDGRHPDHRRRPR